LRWSGNLRIGAISALSNKDTCRLKQKTEEALEKNTFDLRSSEAAILKFLQARLAKKAAFRPCLEVSSKLGRPYSLISRKKSQGP
jgi:hypothetical protein